MASTYPAALDSYTAVTSTTLITSTTPGRTFVQFINDHGDAIEAIEAELGITPSSTYATVKARLDALPTASHTHDTIANVSSGVIMGRISTDAGPNEELTPAQARTVMGVSPSTTTILDTIIDAKGDLIVGTAADTAARKAVGTNGYTLVARSTASDGLTWEAPSSPTLAPNAAADGAWVGPKVTLTAGETLSLGSVCKISTAGKCIKADADAIGTASAQFIALSTFASNSSGSFGMPGGFLYAASLFNFTVGGLVYLSTTAGAVKQTVSSGTDDVVQVVGVATHADKLYFNPSLVQVESV